jgi:phosphoribosyl-ATP pyrophosphohydrolase
MCQSEDLGFRVVRSNRTLLVEFYQPEYNQNLVFSENFGNVSVNSVSMSTETTKNYAIVLGAGDGENRKIVYVDKTHGQDRREIIIDAKDIQMEENETEESYNSRLVARGVEKLLEKSGTYSFSFTPHKMDFGVKYDLGDILIVYLSDYGLKLQARVSKFTQKSQNNKMDTTINVGQITIKR